VKYYLAYGMNTNLQSMQERCPAAQSLGKVMLVGHTLEFKFHADARVSDNQVMECALWQISDKCEQSLDALEGYPHYYQKKSVQVQYNNRTIDCMIYYMVSESALHIPPQPYYDMVLQGYMQHQMMTLPVHQAYERALRSTGYQHEET
jgi:gamma-glutamylcyclotransferase (GGCT)/AIG2-like uncharacterized protein YtfP